MSATRAKFRCISETHTRYMADQPALSRSYLFQAQYDPHQPEDQRYAKATPVGKLEITVDNPAVEFLPGRAYYLDITLVDE